MPPAGSRTLLVMCSSSTAAQGLPGYGGGGGGGGREEGSPDPLKILHFHPKKIQLYIRELYIHELFLLIVKIPVALLIKKIQQYPLFP